MTGCAVRWTRPIATPKIWWQKKISAFQLLLNGQLYTLPCTTGIIVSCFFFFLNHIHSTFYIEANLCKSNRKKKKKVSLDSSPEKSSGKTFSCLEVKQRPGAACCRLCSFMWLIHTNPQSPGARGSPTAGAAFEKGVKGVKLCSPFIRQGQLFHLFPLLRHGERGRRGRGGGSI